MALGFLQGLLNIGRQAKANKALDKLLGQDPRYQQNPFAQRQLNVAQNLFNARMAGAPQLERNILNSQGNYTNNVNRLATDSSQALALNAAGLGQTDDQLSDLQVREAQNKQQMLGNLNNAYGVMINEGDKDYQDLIRRYQNLAEIKGQQQQNKTNALNGVFNGINSDINQALQIAGLFTNPFGAKGSSISGTPSAGGR